MPSAYGLGTSKEKPYADYDLCPRPTAWAQVTRMLLYILELLPFIYQLSVRKGSVTYDLGANISLPPCLSPEKLPPGRNLGEHRSVRRSGATSKGIVALIFCWRMRS